MSGLSNIEWGAEMNTVNSGSLLLQEAVIELYKSRHSGDKSQNARAGKLYPFECQKCQPSRRKR